jgi:hypothetical protein
MTGDWSYYIFILVFSGIGFVYFSYGKKMLLFSYVFAGMSLMIFGYFCDSWLQVLGIGGLLTLAPFVLRYL